MSKKSKIDGHLARLLDEESKGRVCRADLRPDIWPELIKEAADA
jgi:DNA-binding transcriptional regulator YdaS (Cro superfamily)